MNEIYDVNIVFETNLSFPFSSNTDATVLARIKSLNNDGTMQDALLPVELKTGHVQNPSHNHLAQLSTYTFMLRARHGNSASSRIDNGSVFNSLKDKADLTDNRSKFY